MTQPWIPLKERKPAMHQVVIVHTDTHRIEVMIYTGDKFYAAVPPNSPCGGCCPDKGHPPAFCSYIMSGYVTHWAVPELEGARRT